jgi:hypothetical protein
MINKNGILKKVLVLTLVGGLAFWLANFAISRTEIAGNIGLPCQSLIIRCCWNP